MDGIFAPANRLDEIASEIRTTWARIERDIPTTQRLLNEARDLCRARRVNFDRWCKSGKFGIHKTQIYNLLKGQSSSHVHPMDVLHGKTDKRFWLTPPAKLAEVYRVFNITYDACPFPRPPGFDSLVEEWGTNTYVNSLFDNLGPFVEKAIEESKKGKLIVLVMPTNAMRLIQQLIKAGATQWGEMESVDWEATDDRSISPDPLLCVWLVLRPADNEEIEDDENEVHPRRSMDDNVTTSHEFARRIVEHFPIRGRVLDPCRGGGAFYDALPGPKFWCEIKEGRDFMNWTERVDWIVTNPGWSTEVYRAIARHAYKIADNVVFLVRWHNATGTTARHYDWLDAGHGWRETIVVPWRDAGFINSNGDEKHAEGFCVAVLWWQRGWTGPMTTTYWSQDASENHVPRSKIGREHDNEEKSDIEQLYAQHGFTPDVGFTVKSASRHPDRKILDLSAGNRAIWFDKRNHPDRLFIDHRATANANIICDSKCLPLADNQFDLIVFDPPHTANSPDQQGHWNRELYGSYRANEIRELIEKSAKEAWRVAKPDALMAFKWSDHDQKLPKMLELMPQWEPLFGHKVSMRTLHSATTYWVLLRRLSPAVKGL